MASFWKSLHNTSGGRKVRIAGGAILAVIIVLLVLLVVPTVGLLDINGSLSSNFPTGGGGSSLTGVYNPPQ